MQVYELLGSTEQYLHCTLGIHLAIISKKRKKKRCVCTEGGGGVWEVTL